MRRALLAGACAALALGTWAAVAPAATVTTMVVAKTEILRDARGVDAVQRRVTVGHRRCTVGARTPLAALARMRLSLRVRDYGRCGRRPRDAAGLFVTAVAGRRNRGADGWVYKVGHRAGSGGAADPAGPFGTGRRLRDGDRLLWFWCVAQRSGGCQRTLDAVPDRRAAAPGEAVRVTVRGYDDSGRGVPVAGATVTLGSASAVTGADGVAAVPVTSGGRLRLRALARGMVPSFPSVIVAG